MAAPPAPPPRPAPPMRPPRPGLAPAITTLGPAAPQPPATVPGGAPIKMAATATMQAPARHICPVPQVTQTVGSNPHPPAQRSQSQPADTAIAVTSGNPYGFAPFTGAYR